MRCVVGNVARARARPHRATPSTMSTSMTLVSGVPIRERRNALVSRVKSSSSSTHRSSRARRVITVSSSRSITFVRHGQSTWNSVGRIQGSSNYSTLTDKGMMQAGLTQGVVARQGFDACLASPLARARQTADVVWGKRDPNAIREDRDLREIDLYAFEGLFKHEGEQKFGDAYNKWKKKPADFSVDGHYPVRELWDRATSVWCGSLAAREKERKVLVVAHNAVNQALIGSALGLGPQYFRRLLQSNCAVSRVTVDETFQPNTGRGIVLDYLNQTPDVPVCEKDGVVLIHSPTSVEEEAAITTSVVDVVRQTPVCLLMHTADPPSARLAEAIMDRCSREMNGVCPFSAVVVGTIDEANCNLTELDGVGGSTFIIADKSFCQGFIAQTLGVERGDMFNLSPGGISVFNMKGGPAKDSVAVCINHTLYLPDYSADFSL